MFDSVRVAPPDPTDAMVAVCGDNVPWDCGEHPDLRQEHNVLTACLHIVVEPPASLGRRPVQHNYQEWFSSAGMAIDPLLILHTLRLHCHNHVPGHACMSGFSALVALV